MSKKLSKQFENNRQSILATTSKLFSDKGINVTSFTDISKAVKLSKGTIYYYYPSKDHLIYEVTEYHLDQVTDSIFTWIDTIDDNTELMDAIGMLIQSIFETEDKCRLHICLVSYAIMGNDAIKNLINEKTAKWNTMVEVGLVKTNHANPKQLAEVLFAALDSVIINRVMNNKTISEKDICAHIIQHV